MSLVVIVVDLIVGCCYTGMTGVDYGWPVDFFGDLENSSRSDILQPVVNDRSREVRVPAIGSNGPGAQQKDQFIHR